MTSVYRVTDRGEDGSASTTLRQEPALCVVEGEWQVLVNLLVPHKLHLLQLSLDTWL